MLKLLFQHVDIFYKYKSFFLFEKHWILGMVYTSRTFHFKKHKSSYHLTDTLKYLSFKRYFPFTR